VAGEMLFRSFETRDLALTDDGRTVEGLLVPFGQTAEIWNQVENRILESFDPGSFRRAVKAPNRVTFRIDHVNGELVGFGRMMEERDDGLWGRFRLLETRAAYARELIEEAYSGLSIGFIPLPGGSRKRNGVVHRVACHLDHVAAVMAGTSAYPEARVLAMRSQGGLGEGRDGFQEEFLETPQLDALSARLEASRSEYAERLARAEAVLARG
jgi:HK97 family phage prohead protease